MLSNLLITLWFSNYLLHGIVKFTIQLSRINPIIDCSFAKSSPIQAINVLKNNHIKIM